MFFLTRLSSKWPLVPPLVCKKSCKFHCTDFNSTSEPDTGRPLLIITEATVAPKRDDDKWSSIWAGWPPPPVKPHFLRELIDAQLQANLFLSASFRFVFLFLWLILICLCRFVCCFPLYLALASHRAEKEGHRLKCVCWSGQSLSFKGHWAVLLIWKEIQIQSRFI